MTADIAAPRDLDGNMSPTIAGLSTLLATAHPVRNRAKMTSATSWLSAVMTMPAIKQTLQTLYTG
jgi:hypothetical protein